MSSAIPEAYRAELLKMRAELKESYPNYDVVFRYESGSIIAELYHCAHLHDTKVNVLKYPEPNQTDLDTIKGLIEAGIEANQLSLFYGNGYFTQPEDPYER